MDKDLRSIRLGGFVASGSIPDGAIHDAHVQWNPLQGLTLEVDEVLVFSNLATPGFAPTSEDMLGFSALNIGLSEQVLIDDVTVAVPEPGATMMLASGAAGLCAMARRRRVIRSRHGECEASAEMA